MPRQLRLQYPGALYHVLNRGDRREPIFADARDRRRREFARLTERRRQADVKEEFQPVQRGWCLGSEAFREELLAWMTTPSRGGHYGMERREVEEARARQILAEEMKALGRRAAELGKTSKGDASKVPLASRLRSQTTMSLKWIAQALEMGSWTHVSNLLGALRKQRSLKSED
jgi:hypothetical protein